MQTRHSYFRFLHLAAGIAAAAAFLAPAAPASACDTCGGVLEPGIYAGGAERIGNGVAYSWIEIGDDGRPASLGVTLTESALEGLPETLPDGLRGYEHMVMLPTQAKNTGFDQIGIDWNPKGHDPFEIYGIPHFDFHFYLNSEEERAAITAVGDDLPICGKPFPPAYLPEGYVYAEGAEVPMMGGHWIDPISGEFNGKTFDKTFIYGSYDGKLVFLEPMITRAYLLSGPDFREAIKLPQSYRKSGYYPTHYSIRHDPVRREYVVAIDGLAWHEGMDATPGETSAAKRASADSAK